MPASSYVIGLDFGTDSVRALLVNAHNGEELATSVFYYPRWKTGKFCEASKNQFRQHPLDYIEGIEHTIYDCVKKVGSNISKNIKGISVDTTGSTPVAINKSGTPLSLLPEFENNPNAMFVLWKDHTSVKEAEDINAHAKKFKTNYLQFVGGIYSSEWFWAKLLHILRVDEKVNAEIYSWVEHCDWVPFLLTGGNEAKKLKRGVCSAGHKALWAKEFNGLPPDDFFSSLDSRLKGFTKKLFAETYTADQSAGNLSEEWAKKLGLSTDVIVGIGAFDAHMGAVGGQIEPYYLSKVMGTSTCDMLVAPMEEVKNKLVRGICGQVPGSIIPGMMGMEAGQSAFGDVYAWYRDTLMWSVRNIFPKNFLLDETQFDALEKELSDAIIPALSQAASLLPLNENDELALDWMNGRRTPDANQNLKGAIQGLALGSDAPRIFKALVESTCFGAKAIVDRFISEGIPVRGLIGLGGVAKKSPFIMQMMADVMNMPIKIHRSEQTCALGAAMFAATAAGIYNKVEEAMNAMGQGFEKIYYPNEERTEIYQKRYKKYLVFGQQIESTPL